MGRLAWIIAGIIVLAIVAATVTHHNGQSDPTTVAVTGAATTTRTVTTATTRTIYAQTTTVTSVRVVHRVRIVNHGPAACRTALGITRRVLVLVGLAFTTVQPLGPMVGQAAVAGAEEDTATLQQLSRRLKTINAAITNYGAAITGLVPRFRTAAARCHSRLP